MRAPSRDALVALEAVTQKAINGELTSLAIVFTTDNGVPGNTYALDTGSLTELLGALALCQHRILSMSQTYAAGKAPGQQD